MNINATLFGQMITFGILIWFTMTYVWPLLITAMEERQARIAEGLASAEKGKMELAKAEEKVQQAIQASKNEAAELMMKAQKRADEIVEEAKNTARLESEKIIAAANAQVAQEVQQAKESLKQQVASLALSGAEQILMREVDANAHRDLLAKLSAQL